MFLEFPVGPIVVHPSTTVSGGPSMWTTETRTHMCPVIQEKSLIDFPMISPHRCNNITFGYLSTEDLDLIAPFNGKWTLETYNSAILRYSKTTVTLECTKDPSSGVAFRLVLRGSSVPP